MAGLLGLLDLGAGAITAQNAGVAVAGRNTANVNTEGYSRESVDLSAQPGVPLVGGVIARGALRVSDGLLANRERLAAGAEGRSSAVAATTSSLEQMIVPQSSNLVEAFANLCGALGQLAASPTDMALRQQVVSGASGLAGSFAAVGAAIAQATADANARITAFAKQASEYAAQIASFNGALQIAPDPVIADQRDLAAQQLSAITGGAARIDPDGMMRFVVAGGATLVDGTRAASIDTAVDANYANNLRIDVVSGSHRTDVTSTLDGGQLAGQVAFRDGTAAQAGASLDQLAFDAATQFNAVHAAGAGLDGVAGRALFVAPAQVSGAAAAMAVDPVVAANPRFVAAAAAGAAAGDNRNALALAAMGDRLLAAGGTATFSDHAIAIVAKVGSASRSAATQHTLDASRVSVVKSARVSLSGVSIQEELAKLAQFQHASEAATKFVSTVNNLLGNLIEKL